jgi:hypothetical protein
VEDPDDAGLHITVHYCGAGRRLQKKSQAQAAAAAQAASPHQLLLLVPGKLTSE